MYILNKYNPSTHPIADPLQPRPRSDPRQVSSSSLLIPTRLCLGSPPKQIDADCSRTRGTIMSVTQYLQIPTDELMNWGSYTVQFVHCVTYLAVVSPECYCVPFHERVELHLKTTLLRSLYTKTSCKDFSTV